MVGFLHSPTSEKAKENPRNQLSPNLKRQSSPVDHLLIDPEEISIAFADSLLDFDYVGNWIGEVPDVYNSMDSGDLGENPVGFSSEKVEVDVFEKGTEVGCDGFCGKSEVEEWFGCMDSGDLGEKPAGLSFEKVQVGVFQRGIDVGCEKSEVGEGLVGAEGGKLGALGGLNQEKGELVVGENSAEIGSVVFCEKVVVEEGAVGDGGGKLGDLGCLIEEGIGRVSLDGVSSGLVSGVSCVTAIKSDGRAGGILEGIESGGTESNCGVAMESVVGNDVVENVERYGSEIVNVDGNGVKNDEKESDDVDSDSDSESDSESETSSSSDDDDDEEEEEEGDEKRKQWSEVQEGDIEGGRDKAEVKMEADMEEGEIMASDGDEMVLWSPDEYDEEDDNGGIAPVGPIRSKNELSVLPPVPRVNVALQPQHQTLPVGAILSILGSQVIVEGVEKHNPLNEGSILWITERRSPLGLVDEIFGPVKNPYYIVRYNLESEVPTGIQPGTSVSFVPDFANHILNDKSLYEKGYDASGANDEEISEYEEFSDDEKEAEHRKMLKMKKRGTNDEKVGNKRMDKKKSKRRSGNWKHAQAADMQIPMGQAKLPVDHNKHPVPSAAAPLDQGNGQSISNLGHGLTVQPGLAPAFSHLGLNPGFNPSSGGANGIPFQPPQSMGIPGLPAIGMPWVQNVNPHLLYQMASQNILPSPQQIGNSSNLPSNVVLPGGQSGFSAAPGFVPWPAGLGQNMFNPSPFGIGSPGQQGFLPMNTREQAFSSNVQQMGHNHSFQPDTAISGTPNTSPSFNQGKYSSGHKNPHNRGGGRFGRGRGRGRR